MRILILANLDMGLYKFRRELLMELAKENEVYFCVPNGGCVKALEEMGCKHIPLALSRRGTNPIADLGLIRNYIKLLKKNLHYDIIKWLYSQKCIYNSLDEVI